MEEKQALVQVIKTMMMMMTIIISNTHENHDVLKDYSDDGVVAGKPGAERKDGVCP